MLPTCVVLFFYLHGCVFCSFYPYGFVFLSPTYIILFFFFFCMSYLHDCVFCALLPVFFVYPTWVVLFFCISCQRGFVSCVNQEASVLLSCFSLLLTVQNRSDLECVYIVNQIWNDCADKMWHGMSVETMQSVMLLHDIFFLQTERQDSAVSTQRKKLLRKDKTGSVIAVRKDGHIKWAIFATLPFTNIKNWQGIIFYHKNSSFNLKVVFWFLSYLIYL